MDRAGTAAGWGVTAHALGVSMAYGVMSPWRTREQIPRGCSLCASWLNVYALSATSAAEGGETGRCYSTPWFRPLRCWPLEGEDGGRGYPKSSRHRQGTRERWGGAKSKDFNPAKKKKKKQSEKEGGTQSRRTGQPQKQFGGIAPNIQVNQFPCHFKGWDGGGGQGSGVKLAHLNVKRNISLTSV
jgi:hypothetical protein